MLLQGLGAWPHSSPERKRVDEKGNHADRERYLEAGMDGYLTKPVRLEELERVITEFTGGGA